MIRCKWPILLAMMITAISCSEATVDDADFNAGDSFTNNKIRVIAIDTMTVDFSTMKFDSLATSNYSRVLVGKYSDPTFGEVTATSFMELKPDNYLIGDEVEYDSIQLFMHYDSYYYGDTLKLNTINVRALNEEVKPRNNSEYFYNTSSLDYSDEVLGSITFYPRPIEGDTLKISLSDAYGREIFDALQQDDITSLDAFTHRYKGITIQPDSLNNGSILGFSSATADTFIRLFYSEQGEFEREKYTKDFYLNGTKLPVPFFNRIIAEDPADGIKEIQGQRYSLPAEETNGKSFIQAGTGIATRITIPHLKSLFDIPGKGTILEANLQLYPFSEQYSLQDTLYAYRVDQNNDIQELLTLTDGSTNLGKLVNSSEEFNQRYYSFSLTSYLEDLINTERETNEALIFLPPEYINSVDRLILDASGTNYYHTKLNLIYAIYDEDDE